MIQTFSSSFLIIASIDRSLSTTVQVQQPKRLSPQLGVELSSTNGHSPSSDAPCSLSLERAATAFYEAADIRADEDRQAYISAKPNIHPAYPFKEDGIDLAGVQRILDESGIGFPAYYDWRTRSGCYFCFFQRRNEWVGLKERHPELYELAKSYEKTDPATGTQYTWNQRESLADLEQPERIAEIKQRHEKALHAERKRGPNRPLIDVLQDIYDDESGEQPCFFCHS